MKITYVNKTARESFDPSFQKKWKYPQKVKEKLLSVENFIRQASSLQDVVCYLPFHFHPLKGDRKGEWAINVGKTGYRVTCIPCNQNGQEILNGDIIRECSSIKIIMVTEVSNHYGE